VTTRFALMVLLALVPSACAESEPDQEILADSIDLPLPAPGDTLGAAEREAGLDVVATAPLIGVGERAGASLGTVRVTQPQVEGPLGLQLSVELNGLPPGEHAWHLYDGPCSAADAPVLVALGDSASGRALRIEGSGFAEATTFVPSETLSASRFGGNTTSLRVHSHGEGGPALACADL